MCHFLKGANTATCDSLRYTDIETSDERRTALLIHGRIFTCSMPHVCDCHMLATATCNTDILHVASLALRKLLGADVRSRDQTCQAWTPQKCGAPLLNAHPTGACVRLERGRLARPATLATEFSARSGFVPLSGGPATVRSGMGQFASGCRLTSTGSTWDCRRRRPRGEGASQRLPWPYPMRSVLWQPLRTASPAGRAATCGPRRCVPGRGGRRSAGIPRRRRSGPWVRAGVGGARRWYFGARDLMRKHGGGACRQPGPPHRREGRSRPIGGYAKHRRAG